MRPMHLLLASPPEGGSRSLAGASMQSPGISEREVTPSRRVWKASMTERGPSVAAAFALCRSAEAGGGCVPEAGVVSTGAKAAAMVVTSFAEAAPNL